jgi:hypothetical protein
MKVAKWWGAVPPRAQRSTNADVSLTLFTMLADAEPFRNKSQQANGKG